MHCRPRLSLVWNGGWVNPLSQNFPRAEPLPKQLMEDFKQQIADAASRLAASPVAAFGKQARAP